MLCYIHRNVGSENALYIKVENFFAFFSQTPMILLFNAVLLGFEIRDKPKSLVTSADFSVFLIRSSEFANIERTDSPYVTALYAYTDHSLQSVSIFDNATCSAEQGLYRVNHRPLK